MENALPDDYLFRLLDSEERDGLFVSYVEPTPFTGGPWNKAHQHGGAVSALLARVLGRLDSPTPMRLTRLTLEMFRGVPLTPLRVEARVIRGGKRIQSSEATIFDGETPVARATALRVRETDELAELVVAGSIDPAITPPPEVIPAFESRPGFDIPGYIHACEIVPNQDLVAGEYSTFWAKLRCRVFAGEEPTGIERLAAVVDFASGAGNAMDYTRFSSINPDLTVHILTEPRSDWIAIRGRTLRAIDGIGMSHATIHDLRGPIAEASASLLLGER